MSVLTVLRGVCLLGALLIGATPASAQYVVRQTVTTNGAVTFIGNALGLNKAKTTDTPGTSGTIGTFITTDTTLRDNANWPLGTTGDWHRNSSAARLALPAGSTVLYAELVWSGSHAYGGENVGAALDTPVTFTTPAGMHSVAPDPATARTLGTGTAAGRCTGGPCYYVRTADVTSMVQAGGNGSYTVGGVPATQAASEEFSNGAGWTLAILYQHFSLRSRNLTLFTGAELSGAPPASVSGFCTPPSGTLSGRLAVSALEGDPHTSGAQMLFGPTSTLGSANRLSGPRNHANNFFASQITDDAGEIDTSGTFGTANSANGAPVAGARQSWDIVNVDVSAQLRPAQTTAFARGTTSGDQYLISALGLQIDVGAPVFRFDASAADRPTARLGDLLTYTIVVDNTQGRLDANNVVFFDPPPPGTSFVPGTFTINGAPQPSANPSTGVPLGTVSAGAAVTVTLQVRVDSPPPLPGQAAYVNAPRWTYQYQSCAGQPLLDGTQATNTVTTPTYRISASKTASAATATPGVPLTYTIAILNAGLAVAPDVQLLDAIPAGTTYVPNSTRLNGAAVADAGGSMPYSVAFTRVNSPGAAAGVIDAGTQARLSFQVQVAGGPPSVTNTAQIDPEGATPATAFSVVHTLPVVPRADLSLTKSGQPTVVPGNPATFTITVTNQGPSPATTVSVADPTPAGLTLTTLTGCLTAVAFPCDLGTLASGDSRILTAIYAVPGAYSAPDPIVNTATVSSGVQDPAPNNNSATAATSVSAPIADLSLTKSDAGVPVVPGGSIGYTIVAANAGPSAANGARIVDALPADLTNVSWTCTASPGSDCPSTGTGSLDLTVNLANGGTITIQVTATVSASSTGTLINSAAITPPTGVADASSANDSATTALTPETDVTITKTGPASAFPGGPLAYTIVVTNQGPSNAADVTVSDVLPASLTFVSNGGDCATAFPCLLGTIPAAQSRTIVATFDVPVTYAGPPAIQNTASVTTSTAETNTANNQATATTTLSAETDLQIAKSGPASATPGARLLYTIDVTNGGPAAAASVTVDDPTPAGLTFVSTSGACSTPFPCTLTSLAAGETRTITATYDVPRTYAGGPIANTATISGGGADPTPSNNSASTIARFTATSDVTVTKTVDRPTAAVNETVVFTVRVDNRGPAAATGVQVLDALQAGLSIVSAGASQGTYDVLSGHWIVGTLADGANATLTLTAQIRRAGTIDNMAVKVAGAEPDPDPSNNSAGASITSSPVADLQLHKTADRETVGVGETVTFIVRATNAGPSDATNVSIGDLLPAGLTLIGATPSAGTYDALAGTWTAGTIAAGSDATLTLTAQAVDAGTFVNVARTLTQTEHDPVPLNDASGVAINAEASNLQVLKTVVTREPGVATVGERVRFVILVTNNGPNDASAVRILETLPAGLAFVGALASQGVYVSDTGVWDVGALGATGPSSTARLDVDADVVTDAAIVNTAERLSANQVDTNPNDNRGTATFTSLRSDLQLQLDTEGDPNDAGAEFTFVATVANVGSGLVVGPTVVTLPLPPGASFQSGSPDWVCAAANTVVTCTHDALSLAQDASRVLRITALITTALGAGRVRASVANAGDLNVTNNTDDADLGEPPARAADIQITLGAPDAPVLVGQPAELPAIVRNAGPGAAAAVTVMFALPVNAPFVSITPSRGTCAGTGPVTCQLGDLSPGEAVTVTLAVRADQPGLSMIAASASSLTGDTDLANNAAQASLIAGTAADTDGDGMSDACESRFGLLLTEDDATQDADGDGLSNAAECAAGTHPNGLFTSYFAEGASGAGFFDARFALANPDAASAANVLLRLVREDGTGISHPLVAAAQTHADRSARDLLGDAPQTFSAIIESDRPLATERTMRWDTAGGYGSHSETGIPAAAPQWFVAEGSTTGFELFYLLLNPGGTDAEVEVQYLLPSGPPVVRTYTAAARSRLTIWVNAVPGVEETDVSAVLTSVAGIPIVVERAMYRSIPDRGFFAGEAAAAIPQLARQWHMGEGATGPFFDTFVLVGNPNVTPAEIEALFRKDDGTVITKTYTVAPFTRFTIWVDVADPALAHTNVSTTITSTNDVPIVVERAMWWPGPELAPAFGTPFWSESHLANGSTVTSRRWTFADGEQGGPWNNETYVLVGNTSADAGLVQITLLFEDGRTIARNFPIAGHGRLTAAIGEAFPEAAGRRFGALVQSAGPTPLDLVVERAGYSDALGVRWAAGTVVLATPLP